MYTYHCLNNISETGTKKFTKDFVQTDSQDADAILVRSANMKDMEFGDNLKAIARAGAGVNNIPIAACTQKGIAVYTGRECERREGARHRRNAPGFP